ncbi:MULTISPECIES: DNA-dependent RNA polymerase subunit epsilon [Aerococcus]|uniref:DNA-directed RNA polymerase subunit epsilon n=2 Tax=Aerococcus TaxID=1375 RepID=A0A178HE94_9LACT|nr:MULTISPECIES: DNA-directed RNA polymerase subunit epsilon [Aerococcus]KAA9218693.1 DUF1447 family protein [Aerococcus loyolae]KAA9265004.1 DUF1447 family protein [Aerococcus loyolae]MCY3025852.1 DNA-directed RNA polymerase subunit epsilon [Aerococcus loyolae]MCY3027703.1 DNA-directed RNA polymerase subunit epsilon [Aerococcus loyolae]MCY3029608.1 DNA-directed RNA polymerase subunit epsilon [Aerococcus loyolae]
MIFKVTYQEKANEAPIREKTQALYIESDSIIDVRQQLRENTPYLVEHIQALDEAHLAYEQKSPDFHLTEFDK